MDGLCPPGLRRLDEYVVLVNFTYLYTLAFSHTQKCIHAPAFLISSVRLSKLPLGRAKARSHSFYR